MAKKKAPIKASANLESTNRRSMPTVAVIMGSDSDWAVMQAATEVLADFGITYRAEIVSAHRTPHKMMDFATQALERGYKIIIAGAGGAAHLPGMVAAATTLPVIGVPVLVGKLNGLDSLLSIAQMPRGVPVATMAVDNSFNAGLMAVRMLSIGNKALRIKLEAFAKKQLTKVKLANQNLKVRRSALGK